MQNEVINHYSLALCFETDKLEMSNAIQLCQTMEATADNLQLWADKGTGDHKTEYRVTVLSSPLYELDFVIVLFSDPCMSQLQMD